MARYSRRRGPAVNFEMVDSCVTIPGLSISRSFGRGTLDISASFNMVNLVGVNIGVFVAVRVDGVNILASPPQPTVLNGQNLWWSQRHLVPVAPGFHTIDVQVSGSSSAGDRVDAGVGELIVIELPEWDSDEDLVIL